MDEVLREQCINSFDEAFGENYIALAVGGSYASGLATHKSDLDIIVLAKPDSELAKRAGFFMVSQLVGKICETLVLDSNLIEQTVKQIGSEDYTRFSDEILILMDRIICAQPLKGEEIWKKMLANADLQHYQTRLAEFHQNVAGTLFDDFLGALKNNEMRMALHCLKLCLQHQMMALLCLAGDVSGRNKWITKRVEINKSISNRIKEGFFKHFLGGELDTVEALSNAVDACSRFLQEIGFAIIIIKLAWHENDVEELPYSSRGDAYTTCDNLFLLENKNTFFMKTGTEALAVDVLTAALVSFCYKQRSKAELTAFMRSNWPNEYVSENAVDQHLAILAESGILQSVP